jgi:uncharacterized protein YjbI with pentapeptide repeats
MRVLPVFGPLVAAFVLATLGRSAAAQANGPQAGSSSSGCRWQPTTNWIEEYARGARDFEGCELRDLPENSSLREANLRGSRFNAAGWVTLNRVDFSGTDLTDADLSRIRLYRPNFEGAVLVRANLRGAELSNAMFYGADLAEADLRDTKLQGALLANARGLTAAALFGACGDEATTLPESLGVAPCQAPMPPSAPVSPKPEVHVWPFLAYVVLQIWALCAMRGRLLVLATLPITAPLALTLLLLLGTGGGLTDTGIALVVWLAPLAMLVKGLELAWWLLAYLTCFFAFDILVGRKHVLRPFIGRREADQFFD